MLQRHSFFIAELFKKDVPVTHQNDEKKVLDLHAAERRQGLL